MKRTTAKLIARVTYKTRSLELNSEKFFSTPIAPGTAVYLTEESTLEINGARFSQITVQILEPVKA